jgi:hypothetical protein
MYISCVLQVLPHQKTSSWKRKKKSAPSALDPTNDIPTEPKRVRRVAQPALRALEHGALVDQAVEHLPPLRQELVQPRLCAT